MQYKQLFQRMNLDADVRSLQPGEYRKLYNGTPISPAASSSSIKDVISSVLGNALISYSLPSGTNKVIGYLEDRAGNRGFYFVYNSTAANNSIYQISGTTITLVLRSALLDFLSTDFIHADIVGDVLTFTNQRTDIYKINVASAIAGGVYTPLIEELVLIKRPPNLVCTWALGYDALVESNNLAGNYFSFYYRFIYEDKDYSVFSEFSKVTNSWALPSIVAKFVSAETNISLSGISTIDGVAMVNGDKILVTAQTSKVENGLYTIGAGAWARVDLTAGDVPTNTFVYISNGLKFYSTVWQFVDTGVVIVGTNDMYWRQIEGPNYITVTRNGAVPATVTKIEYGVRVNGGNEIFVYREERPAFSSSHTFYNDSYLFTVPDSESFKWNDSVPIKTKSLQYFKNRLFLFNNTEGYTHNSTQQVTLTATPYAGTTLTKAFQARKAGGSYNVGLIFFDAYGRHSGVQMVKNITIQDSNTNRYNITVDTSGVTAPPFATHYSVAITKCINTSFFLKDTTVDIYFYNKDANGDYTYSKTSTGSEGTLIDISSLTKNNRGYTFSAGDRIKIYNPVVSGYGETIIDVEIQGQVGNYVITRLLTELVIASACTNLVFEIYTPKVKTFEPFYAIGERYAIASLAAGSHLLTGDVEVVKRPVYSDSSAYSTSDPFGNSYVATSLTSLESMNAWDKNFTNWVTQGGKSLVKTDSYELLKTGYIRFSNQYVQGANFLGINTFDALDEYSLPIENGPGVMLSAEDVLVASHEIETSSIYIGEGFVNTTNENNFLAKTESVVGDDRKLLGGFGTQTPASVVTMSGRTYFLDLRKGAVVRRSQDGLTVISDYGVRGEISTLCNTHIALGSDSRIIGGWDPQYECYVLSFIRISTGTGYTYYFHEKTNSWVFLSDLRPEFWGILNKRQLAFTAGALYMQSIETNYNLFFGVQYNRRLEFEISPMQSLVHLWDAIEVDVASIYATAGTNEDVVLLYHTNGGTLQTRINYLDFQLKEGVYRSSFFRDLNDINFQNTTESKYKSPNQIRGQSAFLVITYNGTDKNVMKSITVFYTPSMNSSP